MGKFERKFASVCAIAAILVGAGCATSAPGPALSGRQGTAPEATPGSSVSAASAVPDKPPAEARAAVPEGAPDSTAGADPAGSAAAARPSDQEVKSFAAAYVEVVEIQQELQYRMAETETPQEQQQVREEATAQMVDAVQKHEISPEDFDEMAERLETDDRLRARVQNEIQALMLRRQ